MNQLFNPTNPNGDSLANDIWAMLRATSKSSESEPQIENFQSDTTEQNEMSEIPDLATEILSKLEQKKESAAAHLGISKAEVETMPFDLTALEQSGIFLNIDATIPDLFLNVTERNLVL